ncbi:thioredoxin domain-containing protein [Aquimarina sp. D1M17]|uniref:thioredoxin domain-containing protein n=1 Tax=Aquimarina acroporae TaxID=2937283 RepID=UPI0020BD657D|nr:thioredoxin domain-containing protein [Aquimarina acroporae]MCK8522418.1 thioredoxin domain-containing protein [Aquimarina acroporae]
MKYWIISIFIITFSCTSQNKTTSMQHAFTNDLINESSPYLLQHAHNPVNWKPWGEEALNLAKKENKLVVISIGYAACHWCHVMEHESFEDPEVAKLMNDKYINIKVDREERPDVDQVYMSAVQLMTGSGGWPLNVITLPDGRPVWGGTYFPKGNWVDALNQISGLYEKQPDKLLEYAEKLEQGIKEVDLIEINTDEVVFEEEFISSAVDQWSKNFDHQKGGTKRVPKFMMPNNYQFLLRYAHQTQNKELLDFVKGTLTKISFGGVYDHVGGGFARYSTDGKWHVPHFEKMLYDNAQLVSLYADAYLVTKDPWFKDVVYETLEFVDRELTNEEGAFYSSLDADSTTESDELEEGAFYVWTKEEIKNLIGNDYDLFSAYYNINAYGLWEKGNYVLIRKDNDKEFVENQNIDQTKLSNKVKKWKQILLDARQKRSRPRLDDKTLTSWNALMLKGYLDAYRVFGEKKFLTAAEKNAEFIASKQLKKDYSLLHNYKNGKSTINGYLEDYALVINAFLELYQTTFDEKWLNTSKKLADYSTAHFLDKDKNIFYFTSDKDPKLIARTIEYADNVIPASNSVMAKNLFLLSHYFDNTNFRDISISMLHNLKPQIASYPSGYSNWLDLMLNYTFDFYEVVIVGKDAKEKLHEFNNLYVPNKLLAGSTFDSQSSLLKNRFVEDDTLFYVCVNNACKFPVNEAEKAHQLLH